MTHNILLNTDSYKASHFLQYPPGTTHISSYIESRGGKYTEALFFGLQMFIKEYLLRPFTQADIDQAEKLITAHGLPFNREGWEYILTQHKGLLPIEISAIPEGLRLPVHNVMVQVVNTDPKCFWVTNYLETAILRAVWYPTTVATVSWNVKQIIKEFMQETADDLSGLPFKLHDFGARGASSCESAAIGDCAHLVNFMGTDTLVGVVAAQQYYQEPMAGFSIPAAEHSTITSWGKDNEVAAYENMLDQFGGPDKIVAVVSDSYNLWDAINNLWGKQLKEKVMNHGGTLVVRPDSGDPVSIVTECIESLMAIFGFETNNKGYRVLPKYLRVIQGDGVGIDTIRACLAAMKANGQSAENIAFGMGGALLQQVNRDTLKFAMKASAIQKDGEWIPVFKNPVTDPGKRSKQGRLALVKNKRGDYRTIRLTDLGDQKNLLKPVFRDGKLLVDWRFSEIRKLVD